MSEFLRFRGDTSTKHADISKIVNIAKAIGICHKRIPRANSTKMGIKPNNNSECWEMLGIMYCQKSKQKTLNSQVHSVYFVPIHQMGQLSTFPCSFPTKKPCQILPAWLGVGDLNFLPLPGLRQTHRGRRNRRVLRLPPREAPRSPRPQRRGREAGRGASGTVQFPADPERGIRGGDAGGPKASLALDRRRGCHGHGKGEFSAMIVLELLF